jgi:hypothetical protein
MIDPERTIEFDGKEMAIKDVPDAYTREMLGYGHSSFDVQNRTRWPEIGEYEPGKCLRADELKGIWINKGENLACPGCGLDFT